MQTNNKPNGTERRMAQSYQLIPQIPELIKQSTQQQQQQEREQAGREGEREYQHAIGNWVKKAEWEDCGLEEEEEQQ